MKPTEILHALIVIVSALLLTIPVLCRADRLISGIVMSEIDGSPIEGARITAWDADPLNKDDKMGSSISDESGHYQIKYPKKHWDADPFNQGKWRPDIYVTVDLRDHNVWVRVNRTPSSGDHGNHKVKNDITINPKIKPPAYITGIVKDANGAPVDNATVQAFDADPGEEDLMGEAITDANGVYKIEYSRKQWDPYPHQSGLWRPDIFVKATSSDGKLVGRSDIFRDHRVAEDLTVNVVLKSKSDTTDKEATTCDGKPRGTNTKLWVVPVLNPVTRCNMPEEYFANSEEDAISCARTNGYEVVEHTCEYVVLIYSSDRKYCNARTLQATNRDNAISCARLTDCAGCLAQDITPDVTPLRTPGFCTGGIDWSAVDNKLDQTCGH